MSGKQDLAVAHVPYTLTPRETPAGTPANRGVIKQSRCNRINMEIPKGLVNVVTSASHWEQRNFERFFRRHFSKSQVRRG